MNHLRFLFLLLFFSGEATTQTTDSLMRQIQNWPGGSYEKIAKARNYLRDAFTEGDWGLTNAWLGFLQNQLDDSEWAPTQSDERWLLYFWTENFGVLFSEVADYQRLYKEKYQFQNEPPDDDLFRIVDQTSFDRQHELYSNIRKGFLSEEEGAFSILLLDFLLRKDATDEGNSEKNFKASNFIKKYPNSRFNAYIRSHIFNEYKPGKEGFVGDALFIVGLHDRALGLNFEPYIGFAMNLTYWRQKIHYGLRFDVGGQSVRRAFPERNYLVEPDSSAIVFDIGPELGFDLADTRFFHFTPNFGCGWSFLRVPSSPQFDTDPFEYLKFNTFYWTAAINIDWKYARSKSERLKKEGTIWWPGVRFRFGYRHLNFGAENLELAGSQIFASVGVSVYSRPGVKKI